MTLITSEQLKQLGATRNDSHLKYAKLLNDCMQKYEINTKNRVCHFLSQIYVESNCLSVVKENLNYSAERLLVVWPSRFKTIEQAREYERNAEKLANYVYGGRIGNNNKGDGYRYIGRGLKQITGKANYEACGIALNIDCVVTPELLEFPMFAVESACWFWSKMNLNKIADIDDGFNTIKTITKIINGGTNGLKERNMYYEKAKTIF